MVSGPITANGPTVGGLGNATTGGTLSSTSPNAANSPLNLAGGSDVLSTMIRNNQLLLEVNQLEQQLLSKSLGKDKDKTTNTIGLNGLAKPLTKEELVAQEQAMKQANAQLLALKEQELTQARQAIANVDKTLLAFPSVTTPAALIAGSAVDNYPKITTL